MKEFKSVFIGIPLPDQYLNEFGNLLSFVKSADPGLDTVDTTTPHITIYYLDRQPESNFEQIKEVVDKHTSVVRNTKLVVGGIDTFEEPPKVLFLPVVYPESLLDFAGLVTREVASFIKDDSNLPFHPHMTVAFLNQDSQVSWDKTRPQLAEMMDEIKWDFQITEVVIYGTEVPTEQFKKAPYGKLISISV